MKLTWYIRVDLCAMKFLNDRLQCKLMHINSIVSIVVIHSSQESISRTFFPWLIFRKTYNESLAWSLRFDKDPYMDIVSIFRNFSGKVANTKEKEFMSDT